MKGVDYDEWREEVLAHQDEEVLPRRRRITPIIILLIFYFVLLAIFCSVAIMEVLS